MTSKNRIFISSCLICLRNLRNLAWNCFSPLYMGKVVVGHVVAHNPLSLEFPSISLLDPPLSSLFPFQLQLSSHPQHHSPSMNPFPIEI